jgi:hypothetical protein
LIQALTGRPGFARIKKRGFDFAYDKSKVLPTTKAKFCRRQIKTPVSGPLPPITQLDENNNDLAQANNNLIKR